MKKTGKGNVRAKGKGTTKKEENAAQATKGLSPAEVREGIAKMVKSHAKEMAAAVIKQGEEGQLATVRYLWELASIFPGPAVDNDAKKDEEEESLAQTLLKRLDILERPGEGEDAEDDVVVISPQIISPQIEEMKVVEESVAEKEPELVGV